MASPAQALAGPWHFVADVFDFKWSTFAFRLPVVSAAAVALCLFAGILVGHPGAGLVAGGGAFTVGFGANQRIADSRLIPMIAAVFATSTAALAGTVAGHRDMWLVFAAAGSALLYGFLTARNAGVAWVGQQAFVAMVISSAFPSGPEPALTRAGLIGAGGVVQLIFTSAGLRLMPDLRKDLFTLATRVYGTLLDEDDVFLGRLRRLQLEVPTLPRDRTFGYSVRLMVTAVIATEVYRRLGVQSGYWIPMTALLVQRTGFRDTFTRAAARILGTLAGAWLGSLFIAHVILRAEILAAVTAAFAFLAFAANAVNYGLFTTFLTGYIVFLLSLNEIPGPVIAHRRAWCTALGAAIALAMHVDALLRSRRSEQAPEQQTKAA